MVALQDERGSPDHASAPQRALQRLEPVAQRGGGQAELLDDRDFLAAAALALQPDHGPRRGLRSAGASLRFARLRTARQVGELVLQSAERIVEGLLLVHAS